MKHTPSWKFLGAVEINGEWRCYWRKDYGDDMCQIHEGWHSPDMGLLDKGFAEQEIAFLIYTLQREGVAVSHATIEPVRTVRT